MNINFTKVMAFGKAVGSAFHSHRKGILIGAKWLCYGGAVAYAVSKAPSTMRDLEEAGEKKGEELTFLEKTGIVVKSQYPAIIMAGTGAAADITKDVLSAKEVKAVTAEKASLISQVADLSTAYNTVNDIKNAMTKKVEEVAGPDAVEQVRKDVEAPKFTESYSNLCVGDRAIVMDRNMIEKWNMEYLKTGNTEFKIQEYFIPMLGQSFLSCNYAVHEAAKKVNMLMNPETGKGYASLNDWLEPVGARTVGTRLGEDMVWRYMYETFGTSLREYDLDGVAVFEIVFYSEPYNDAKGEFCYM